jgi:hypothetical protein
MADLVACYSGSQYAEYPLAFQFQGEVLSVDEILARGRTPAGKCFRVRTAQAIFDLTYDEVHDQWRVEPLFVGHPALQHNEEPA